MAVGYWKSPTEATYLAPGDASQNHHLEGMPFGTRGGMLVRHDFPADGEYKFSIQNFGIGSFIPGEQLELIIDGERAHVWPYRGVGLSRGHDGGRRRHARGDGSGPGRLAHGRRDVPRHQLPPEPRHDPAVRSEVAREQHASRSCSTTRRSASSAFRDRSTRSVRHDSRSRRKVFTCRPAHVVARRSACATADPDDAGAPRLSASADGDGDRDADDASTTRAASGGDVRRRHRAGAAAAAGEPAVPGARRARAGRRCRAGQPYRITDLELASRLSFFLWSSIPDDELITVASQGRLSQPTVLEQQVRRMLADPRSDALVTNFAQQLLYLRNLPATSPDGVFYPNWDDELRQSFRRETELFFDSIMREDRNVVDLLTADYTFVNERLARHYGIPNIYGSQFRRVTLRPGAGLPARAARQGQLPRGDLDAELPDVAGQARRVGAREHSRHAAAGAAAERAGARGHQERGAARC